MMKKFIIVNDGQSELSWVVSSEDELFAKLTNKEGLDEDGVLRNLSEFDNENKGLSKATTTRVECGNSFVELFKVDESDLKAVLKTVNWCFRYDAQNSKELLLAFLLGDNYTDAVEMMQYNGAWVAKQ